MAFFRSATSVEGTIWQTYNFRISTEKTSRSQESLIKVHLNGTHEALKTWVFSSLDGTIFHESRIESRT